MRALLFALIATLPAALRAEDTACTSSALPEGPAAVGFLEADWSTGRRACPRTEVGLGGRFAAIIDTPGFYGNLAVNGLVFGSWAVRPDLELFGTLEAVSYNFAQNAVLKATQLTLGNLTAGASWAYLRTSRFTSALTGRLLLPTSLEIPGAHVAGIEVGDNASLRPLSWLEVHGYLGAEFTAAFSRAESLPRVGGVLLAGVALSPVEWGALVVDLNGRLGPNTWLAPAVGLRFKIFRLGIELSATLPVAGSDRHNFLFGGRFSWRFD
jgi:hypothetical protein